MPLYRVLRCGGVFYEEGIGAGAKQMADVRNQMLEVVAGNTVPQGSRFPQGRRSVTEKYRFYWDAYYASDLQGHGFVDLLLIYVLDLVTVGTRLAVSAPSED